MVPLDLQHQTVIILARASFTYKVLVKKT